MTGSIDQKDARQSRRPDVQQVLLNYSGQTDAIATTTNPHVVRRVCYAFEQLIVENKARCLSEIVMES